MARQLPTRRQLEVLRAYIAAGSITGAAETLDISESTVRQHLSGPYRRTGCLNAAQAGYLLGAGVLTRHLAPSGREAIGQLGEVTPGRRPGRGEARTIPARGAVRSSVIP